MYLQSLDTFYWWIPKFLENSVDIFMAKWKQMILMKKKLADNI